ncbi:MAG TPA: hypothetical protein VGT77_04780 [Sphingomonas sp.]|jgi:hypothetical protein|nr:hypothetical protein [Sphingomonas sp.]
MSKDAEREKRLAEALRANLRKRKAQGRDLAPSRNGEGDQPKAGDGGPGLPEL